MSHVLCFASLALGQVVGSYFGLFELRPGDVYWMCMTLITHRFIFSKE